MVGQIARRLSIFAISTIAASMVIFVLLTLIGDPARSILGTNATEEAIIATRQRMGLDQPLISQYWAWVSGMVHGDFGTSYLTHQPIGAQISRRLLVTLYLVGGGIVLALIAAVPLGTFAAIRHRSWAGWLLSGISQLGIAVPAFLAGILLAAAFAVQLQWFPSGGYTAPATDFSGFLLRMTLPWLSLGLVQGAILARYVRSAVLDEINQPYIRTARAKGLTRTQAVIKHGLRNAAIPVLTVLGVQLVTVLIGAVVVERVFVLPGIGSYLLDSVARGDRLAVQGVVIVIVALSLFISFVVDLMYVLLNPQLRRVVAS